MVIFQDVYDALNTGRKTFRQLVIATPIFDDAGQIQYILAVFRRLATLNQEYYLAANCGEVNSTKVFGQETLEGERDIVAQSPQMRKIMERN